MKKLFICVMTSLCSTFAFADADLVVKPATITNGNGTMQVVINNANTTAFQFDVKLPAGISVSAFGTESGNRKFENAKVDANTNTWRFLSYDEQNATFDGGTTLNVTLAAEDGATTGEAETSTILVVDPNGNGSDVDGGNVAVTVQNGVNITVGSTGKTTYVGNVDLDFTGSEASAWVVMGMEGDNFWLARIYKVPAGTPVIIKAAAGTYPINATTLANTYYQNYLVGNNAETKLSVTPNGVDKYYFMGSGGLTPFTETREIGAHKAYIHIDAKPEAKAGSNWPLSIGSTGRTTLCADVDLDFSDQTDVKAYIMMGYDGTFWVAPVKRVSAGTPLYIKGPQGSYSITSTAVQTVFANMLVGNNSDASITIHPTDGEFKNFFLGTGGWTPVTSDRSNGAHKSYLQVKSAYYKEPAGVRGLEGCVLSETSAEIMIMGVNYSDTNKTGIDGLRQVSEQDEWYNLKGQRIDTPTKKGLYIKNGKKVVVK